MRSHVVCTQVEFTQLVGGSINWAFYAQDDKVKLFRGRHENVPLFCAHTEIEATLDDIIPNFLTFDTPSVRASAFTFFPDIMDIVRLYNITMPTPRRPHHYLGINWCLLATPLAGIVVKRRDLCYLEVCTDRIVWVWSSSRMRQYQDNLVVGGKRAWVRALVHVEVPACPDLQLKYGIVRGKMLHSGFIYVECDQPGVLQVFELQHVQPNGSIRGSIGDYLVTKSAVSQCGNLNLLGQKLRAAKLSRLQFLPDHAVVSLSARSSCHWVTYKPSLALDSISDATSPMSTPHHTNTPSLLAQSSTPLRAKQDMPFGRYAVALGKIGTASLSSSTGANRAYHQTQ
ncbi:hypothetical protein DYB32_003967 [Aphanomyces invadans]|uniref:Uncharacterized protein n=1 Tax=Aphanomyces invadans TaxID=157072 RepID=A0A3R6VYQ1_9STRA|nr:hypothetical protein DYB32_003967 [Aphanomyces invadans]